jgi:glutaredoxin-like protein NrdH
MTNRTESMITVYTKPACPQCIGTKRYLDKAGVDYETIDVTLVEGAREAVEALGYTSMPVVVAGEDHWAGLHVDRIMALAGRDEI